MAILEKKIKGKSYFYEVKSYREDGKIKQKILRYFGREDPRKNPDAKPVVKQQVIGTYKFGEVALLWHCAKQIKFVETIDKYMPKRQGLSHGLLLFLLASHRIFGDKPSAENLQDWVKRTFLPLFLDFTSKKINKNSISYTMDSVIDEERKIDQTFHIARDLYDIAKGKLGKDEDIYFYDITSTYFEGRSCPLAFLGYSRDGLSDKLQINIGLIVDKTHGLPLMTKVFDRL
jgi:transposase